MLFTVLSSSIFSLVWSNISEEDSMRLSVKRIHEKYLENGSKRVQTTFQFYIICTEIYSQNRRNIDKFNIENLTAIPNISHGFTHCVKSLSSVNVLSENMTFN